MGEERATVKHGSRYGRDSLTDVIQQRKERVVELFGQKVDLDEVKRMSNGKWVCLICHWRPVLDTVEVLMVHRNSKKHKAQVEARKQKEQENEEKKVQNKRSYQQTAPQPSQPSVPQATSYPPEYQNQYYGYYQYPGYEGYAYPYPYGEYTQYYDNTQPSNDNTNSSSNNTATQISNAAPVTPPVQTQTVSQPAKKAKTTPFSYEDFMKEVEWNKWATLCKQKGWTLDDNNHMKKVEGVEFDSDDDEPPAQPKGEIPTTIVQSLKKYASTTEKKDK